MDWGGMSREQAESMELDMLREARREGRKNNRKIEELEERLEDLEQENVDLKWELQNAKRQRNFSRCPFCNSDLSTTIII